MAFVFGKALSRRLLPERRSCCRFRIDRSSGETESGVADDVGDDTIYDRRDHGQTAGLIEVGQKKADVTVLEQKPYDVTAEEIRNIVIWGTVFGGSHIHCGISED